MKKAFSLLKFIVNLSLGCLIAVTAYGATLEVGPSGYPYTSIQAAITAATTGDIVLVHDGTYVENINFSGKAITVRSANGAASTIIDGNASGSVVTFNSGEGSGSILNGFTIRNGSATGGGGGIYCSSSAPTITNCTITGNTAYTGGGIGCRYASAPTITNCIISGNKAYIGGGIYSRESSPTITNCTISGNEGTATGGGIESDTQSSAIIANCTITGNTAGDGGGFYGYASSSSITNCTISGNTATLSGGGICLDNASASVKNSILWGNVPDQHYLTNNGQFSSLTYTDIDDGLGDPGNSYGNIRQDPLFVDPANDDFRLQPTSPCIDAGTSDSAPSTDRDGFPRYDYPPVPNTGGGAYPYYDMGAYEKQGAVTPVEGTIGSVLTINGSDFGTNKGKVIINGIAAKIVKDGWETDQITCTVSKPPLPVDVAHLVSVVVNKVSTPLDGTFTLRGLVLDELLTSSGAYPEEITVTGKFFSTKKGKVYLYDPVTEKKKNCKVTDWKMNESTGISELTFAVPKPSKSFPAATYQLKISNKIGPATTTPDFELLDPGP